MQVKPVTPIEEYIHVDPSPKPVPRTTAQAIGWRSTHKDLALERYGKYAKPKGGLVKQLNWPQEAIDWTQLALLFVQSGISGISGVNFDSEQSDSPGISAKIEKKPLVFPSLRRKIRKYSKSAGKARECTIGTSVRDSNFELIVRVCMFQMFVVLLLFYCSLVTMLV